MTALDLGLLALRLTTGAIFAAHGAQKAFGWWGGPGWSGWRQAMTRMGLRPATIWAALSAGAELVGGVLLAVGLLVPLAAAFLVAQSVVIIVRAHWARGFWNRDGGIEFPLALLGGALALAATGPGSLSVDAALGLAPSDALRLGILAVALVGGIAAILIRPAAEAPAGQTA